MSATLKRYNSETEFSKANKKHKSKSNSSNKNNRSRKRKQKRKQQMKKESEGQVCAQCGWVPGANPLSELQPLRNQRRLCKGCQVFFSCCVGEEEEATHWVRTGEWLTTTPVPVLDEDELLRRFELKAIQINLRPSRSVPGWAHNPGVSGQDLMDLYDEWDRQCRFSGLMANMHEGPRTPYWALSVDHIDPVNGQQEERLYGIDNLQIMISVFNSVKANYTTEQLQEWYLHFKASL